MGHRSLGACGLGLGGGIALLLLARRKGAAGAFGLAFVALVVTLVHEYGVAGALPVMGQKAMALSDILLVVSAAQWEYARRLARAGVLAGRCCDVSNATCPATPRRAGACPCDSEGDPEPDGAPDHPCEQ